MINVAYMNMISEKIHMRKCYLALIVVLNFVFVLVFSLAACSNTQQKDAQDPVSSEAPSHAAESTPAEGTETKGSNILIAYFTYGEMRSFPMTGPLLHQPVFKSLTVKSQAIPV